MKFQCEFKTFSTPEKRVDESRNEWIRGIITVAR